MDKELKIRCEIHAPYINGEMLDKSIKEELADFLTKVIEEMGWSIQIYHTEIQDNKRTPTKAEKEKTKMIKYNEKSIYWKLISDFMLKLDSDIIAVGEDRAKIKRELLYWVNTI